MPREIHVCAYTLGNKSYPSPSQAGTLGAPAAMHSNNKSTSLGSRETRTRTTHLGDVVQRLARVVPYTGILGGSTGSTGGTDSSDTLRGLELQIANWH